MSDYDSTAETKKHIGKVQSRMLEILDNLSRRSSVHDASKLQSPEKESFDSLGPPEVMAALVYGSEEYKANLRKIKPAIEHHYSVNDHHPEHFRGWVCNICFTVYPTEPQGWCTMCHNSQFTPEKENIGQMSLMALLEMLADWKAAGERHTTGNLRDSIEKNTERFHISSQLKSVLVATAIELGWL